MVVGLGSRICTDTVVNVPLTIERECHAMTLFANRPNGQTADAENCHAAGQPWSYFPCIHVDRSSKVLPNPFAFARGYWALPGGPITTRLCSGRSDRKSTSLKSSHLGISYGV